MKVKTKAKKNTLPEVNDECVQIMRLNINEVRKRAGEQAN